MRRWSSRVSHGCLGSFGGIAGAFVALHAGQRTFQGKFRVLPVVAAIFGYAVASAMFVLIAGDLVVRPKPGAASFPDPRK